MGPVDVSVLIVNYNGADCVEPLLNDLRHAFLRWRWEVVVVDNASSDGSGQHLRARNDIRLIELAHNTGFSGGNNVAAAHARGKVLLLLNNDTRVHGHPGTEGAYQPFFSPDGQWVGFFTQTGELKKIALALAAVVLVPAGGRRAAARDVS
ncbi:MAG: glycosyltransferase [Aquincola sp.]|nr:glycosyltransferase [Aquincola sp.]